jgi:signal transduction histidine kinase
LDSQAPGTTPQLTEDERRSRDDAYEEIQKERERLLGSLHDTVLQSLEYIASGGYGSEPDPQTLRAVAARAADDLRACLEGLHDEGEDSCGLLEGLREVVAEAQALAKADLQLVEGPNDGSVEGSDAAALTLAVREALTNVRKHARASRVIVYCESEDGQALVTVRDDGVGMERKRIRGGGLGVRHSIIQRLADHSGEASFESSPGCGTVVTLRLGDDEGVAQSGVQAGVAEAGW